MPGTELLKPRMTTPARFSYWFILGIFVLIDWLHLAGPFLVILFAYLAITKLNLFKRWAKWPAVLIFLIFLAGAIYGLGAVINQAVKTLPELADKVIPDMLEWAQKHNIKLPDITDFQSLKEFATESVKSETHYLGSAAKVARGAGTQFVFVLIAIVVAISIFLNPRLELGRADGAATNFYSACCDAVAERFKR